MTGQFVPPRGMRFKKNGKGMERYFVHFIPEVKGDFARGIAAATLCNSQAGGPEEFTKLRTDVTCARCKRLLADKANLADSMAGKRARRVFEARVVEEAPADDGDQLNLFAKRVR